MNEIPVTMPVAPETPQSSAFDDLPVGYAELDARGAITYANLNILASYPSVHGSMIGRTMWALMPTREQERSCAAFFLQMESSEAPPVVRRCFYTNAGEFRVYELHRKLILDADGRPAGMRVVSLDVTEKEKALDAAMAKSLWLESVLESLPEAVIATDALGSIRYANPAAVELSGWKAQELIGETIENKLSIVTYNSADHTSFPACAVLDEPSKGVATMRDRQHRELRVEIETSPVVDKDKGFTAGVVSVLRKLENEG